MQVEAQEQWAEAITQRGRTLRAEYFERVWALTEMVEEPARDVLASCHGPISQAGISKGRNLIGSVKTDTRARAFTVVIYCDHRAVAKARMPGLFVSRNFQRSRAIAMFGAMMRELHNPQQRPKGTSADAAKAPQAVGFDNHMIVVGRNVIKARRVLQHKNLTSGRRQL